MRATLSQGGGGNQPIQNSKKNCYIARLLLGSVMQKTKQETLQKYLEDISHIKESDKEHIHRTALQNLLESQKYDIQIQCNKNRFQK